MCFFNWHYSICSLQITWWFLFPPKRRKKSSNYLLGLPLPNFWGVRRGVEGLQRTDQCQLAIIKREYAMSTLLPLPHSSYPPCLIAVLGIRQADKTGEAPSLQDGFWGVEWDKSASWWRRRGGGGGELMALWDGATIWSITSQQPIPPPCMRTCVRV